MCYNMTMSIFKDSVIDVFKKIRQIFLKIIVGIIIGEIVLLAVLIIAHNANEIIGKMMGTLLLIVVEMVIVMSCFRCIEKRQNIAQVLALICMGTSVFWFIFQALELWGVIPMFATSGGLFYGTSYSLQLTPVAKFVSLISNITLDALIGAWISSIAENGGPIKPLKITALSSLVFIFVVSLIQVFADNFADSTILTLYGLAVLSLLITWCMAASISRKNKKEKLEAVANNSDVRSEEM